MPLVNRKAGRIDWAEVKSRLAKSQAAIENVFVEDEQRSQEMFHRRALQLASRRHSPARTPTGFRALVFSLGPERYGLEICSLVEVLPFAHCTPVPGGPAELVGVVNRRGAIRSVVSLSRMLGLAGPGSDERGRGYIVLVRSGDVEVGLRVDQVEGITLVSPESWMAAGKDEAALRNGYVQGVTPDGLIIVDLPAVFSHPVFKGRSLEATGTGGARRPVAASMVPPGRAPGDGDQTVNELGT
jgi:purine-binding chemotaxis protein CheW